MTDRPWKRQFTAWLWKGLAGMPLALRLSDELGIGVCKQSVKPGLQENLVPIDIRAPFFGNSISVSHGRKFSIVFPCVLVCGLSFGADKAAEHFNGGAMRQEGVFDVGVDVRSVVRTVVACNIYEGQSWRECCTESSSGNVVKFPGFELSGQPISNEAADQGAKHSKAAADKRNVVSGYAFHGTKFQFALALFGGFMGALVFIAGFAALARWVILTPNVRAEAGPTAKRQARVVENAPAHCAGLAF